MKTSKIIAVALAVAAIAAVSCKKQQYPMYQAVVTVKTLEPSTDCVFQLDDKTILKPENISGKLYDREVRAMTVYYDKGEIQAPLGNKCQWHSVQVAAVDSIRTKAVVPSGALSNSGIEIVRTWMNTIEDGYLTLVFEAKWGNSDVPHLINLEKTDVPYVYTLKHDDNGDDLYTHYGQGVIAFDLHDQNLPTDTDKEFKFQIKYMGYNGKEKAVYFQYKDGAFTGPFKEPGEELGEEAESNASEVGFMFN